MKLSTRLTVTLIVLSLLPVIVVGAVGYHNGRQSIQKSTFNRLISTNILKEAEFNRWIQASRLHIRAMAQRPLVRQFTEILCASDAQTPDWAPIYRRLIEDHLTPGIQDGKGFVTFSILRVPDGMIAVSTLPHLENKYRENTPYFKAGQHSTYVDDVTYSLSLEQMVMHISTPIVDDQGEVIAVLSGHVDWHEMSKIMLMRSGISNSEESYLVNELSYFVTESRFEPDVPMIKSVHTKGVEACLAGGNGVDLYPGYRNIPVIGAYRWMNQWGLCIITEENQAEAFAPNTRFRNVVLGVGGIVAFLVSMISFLFGRTATRRIDRLVSGADKIGGGSLDHRIAVDRNDELGLLAQALNTMARHRQKAEILIRQSHDKLESRVAERTNEIEETNRRLTRQIIVRTQAEEKLQQSLSEKEVLLREIHHRVKNNLQMVQSLINLQASKLDRPEFFAALMDSNNRIKSMALIHETLYRSEDMAHMDLDSYFQQLTHHLQRVYQPPSCHIDTQFDITPLRMDMDASIACGLMVNELVTNALKYAFQDKPGGRLHIGLHHIDSGDMAELTIRDNGIGLPGDIDIDYAKSLGLRIVAMLAQDQLNGSVHINRKAGTAFHIRFPIQTDGVQSNGQG